MRWILHRRLLIIAIAATISIACKKEYSCEKCGPNNRPPIAVAGPNQTITLPTDSAILDGTLSTDPDGNITDWRWTKISGPAAFSIFNFNTAKTKVSNLAEGIYQFELRVTDAGGLFSLDTMQVIVKGMNNSVLVDVYVAGTENGIAKYWKNVQPVVLNSSGTAQAKSIVVVGSDVYVAGADGDFSNNTSRAKYWKNGQEVFLTGATGATANAITVSGGDVYVAGRENGVAKYWKNGQPVSLLSNAEANAIVVIGNDVYVAGAEYTNLIANARYWKNGQMVTLPAGFFANSIAVVGSDVYVAGCESPTGLWTEAKYWKNGHDFKLDVLSPASQANSIAITGGDIYIAGWRKTTVTGTEAAYWKNGKEFSLTNGLTNAVATSITTFGTDVYVAGFESGPNNTSFAKYWKNGQEISLTGGSTTATAHCIVVVQR